MDSLYWAIAGGVIGLAGMMLSACAFVIGATAGEDDE